MGLVGEEEVASVSSPPPALPLPLPPRVRRQAIEFLFQSSQKELSVPPVVLYTALSFFADRFLPSLSPHLDRFVDGSKRPSWLLNPLAECKLELFCLVSIWISSKLHEIHPLSVKTLKSLGDRLIIDQHFTTRDFVEAELVFMEVLRFNIGASNIAFLFLEDLLTQFREVSRLGDLLSIDVCMEIMDVLYEKEETAVLFGSPYPLAASILVAAYIISVPEKRWGFPLIPWVELVTSFGEEDIAEIVEFILEDILRLD